METGLVRNCINFNFTTWREFVDLIPVMETHSNSDAVKHFGSGYKLVIRSNCRQVAIWGPRYEYNHLNQAELGQLKYSLDIFKEKIQSLYCNRRKEGFHASQFEWTQ